MAMCMCFHSDLLCGTLFCNISAVIDLRPDNYLWGRSGNWTPTGTPYLCRFAYYRTFYNGPDRTDPGFVPNGAACGTEKVAVFDDYKIISFVNSFSNFSYHTSNSFSQILFSFRFLNFYYSF